MTLRFRLRPCPTSHEHNPRAVLMLSHAEILYITVLYTDTVRVQCTSEEESRIQVYFALYDR